MAGFDSGAHQLVAGVGDQRRAGIGDQRHHLAVAQRGHEARAGALGIVIVIGGEAGRDAIVTDELGRHAGIFAGDQIGRGQHVQPPHGNIVEMANRGRNDIEPRRLGRRLNLVPFQRIDSPIRHRPAGDWSQSERYVKEFRGIVAMCRLALWFGPLPMVGAIGIGP